MNMNKVAENNRYYVCLVKLPIGTIVGRIHSAKTNKVILQGFISDFQAVRPMFLHYMGENNTVLIETAYAKLNSQE